MKTLFEQHGGTYTMQGDYRLPNLTVDETDTRPIGVWGQHRLFHTASFLLKKYPTQSSSWLCHYKKLSKPQRQV